MDAVWRAFQRSVAADGSLSRAELEGGNKDLPPYGVCSFLYLKAWCRYFSAPRGQQTERGRVAGVGPNHSRWKVGVEAALKARLKARVLQKGDELTAGSTSRTS